MAESIKQKLGFVVAAIMVVAAVGALNIGTPAGAQANGCEPDGGGGGGNQTESPSPSPTESEEPFPPSLPPIIPSESESESPSPTDSEGQARTCDSKITISYRGPTRNNPERSEFAGKVTSDESACEGGRQVVVKKDRRRGRDLTVETTVTNNRGKWRAPVNRANGKYYAQTPQQRVASDEGRVTCKAAKSRTITV